ncbi:MAG: bifunctional DNA primase/polymerase [Candidatus Nomurabacteria bacterium]|nr:bifunctional DNA primase/polymerase [Candidatus Nomurabacteria bacterium]
MENQNEYIIKLVNSNLSVIPITEGDKRPHSVCLSKDHEHEFLYTKATEEEAKKWVEAGVTSWAIAGGKVSDNLVTLDFDEKHYTGLYDLWYNKLSDEQKKFVDLCHKNTTRNKGTHLRYRTETTQPTVKLARRVEFNEKENKGIIVTTAETKANGGYALIPPSSGYTTIQGSLLDLPIIPDEIHEELIDLLRVFNEVEDEPATEYEWKQGEPLSGNRPGDKFNKKATWNEILEPHGWIEEGKNYWRRPGKEKGQGISATTDHGDISMFYVFSTSAHPFQANKGYSKFTTFTFLNHSGDFKAAAKAVIKMYPEDISKKEEESVSIEQIEEILKQIPSDTPKLKLMEVLSPVFNKLIEINKITAEIFIGHNIKEYFGITKEDAKKYIPYVNSLRIKSFQAQLKAKKEEEKIPLILNRDIDFQEAYDAVLEIGIVNKETLKIVTAVIISAQLRLSSPLWLFLIGVPSSFKTELVGLYSDMDDVYTLDTLTENAFCSGYVPPDGSETQDLLPLLDNKSFIIKDLNTLFSMNEEMVKKILGDLTSIFDGKFQKFTATRGLVEYHSLFSMIGCITPSILIKHYNYATQLGPRFLFLRLSDLTEKEMAVGFDKSWNEPNRKEKVLKTRHLISSYATQLVKKIEEHKNLPETKEIQNKINSVAQFICKARGIAITSKSTFENEKGQKIEFYEIKDWQVEHPWRILNQLKSLLRILCFINGQQNITEEEIKTIKPVILSTMPVDRAEVLKVLTVKCGLSASDLAKEIKKSSKTIRRTLKELEALGILDCYKDLETYKSGKAPYLYFLVEEFANILNAPVPPKESLSLLKSVIEGTSAAIDDDEEDEEITS